MSIRTRNMANLFGDLIIADVNNANNKYYMVASKFTEWANNFVADPADETYDSSDYSFRQEMIFGKKISNTNITYLINRNTWGTGTVYAMYDDKDTDLESSAYYIINNNMDVYKCIFNNNGVASTVEPTTKAIDIFELADGYKWKYMYTLSSANNTKFGSTSYIPVDANTTISGNVISGTIDAVVVESGGVNYEKYVTGSIQQVVSANVFRIDSEKNSSNSYFLNTSLFITSGTGDSSLSEITAHYSNATGNYIQTANSLTLTLTSNYLISPTVYIEGNGSGFKAYSVANLVSGRIENVKIVAAGTGYTYANVYFQTSDVDTGTGATIRAIIAPRGGHGADPAKELNSKRLMLKTEFANNEGSTIPTQVSYRKYGILTNPTYDNAGNTAPFTGNTFDSTVSFTINVSSSNTVMSVGETLIGNTSNAYAMVAYANSTYVIATIKKGTFANNETINSDETMVIGQINSISIPDIHINSGEIIFYDTTTEIVRSNTTTEDVGLILNLG